MQTQTGLIQEQNRVLVFVGRFGKKDHEKRAEPLKTFRALVELDFNAELVFHDDLQILPVGHNAQTLGFDALGIRFPNGAQLLGQSNTRGIQLIRAPIELIAIATPTFLVAGHQFRRLSQGR